MNLSPEQVRRTALLSRLDLTEDEVTLYAEQLGKILEYAEKIKTAAASAEPMITAAVAGNVFREDEVNPCLPRELVLSQAPERDERFFRVPPVIE